MTKRDCVMLACKTFTNALDRAGYTPNERDRMIAGAKLLLRALCQTGLFGPAIADDARHSLDNEQE